VHQQQAGLVLYFLQLRLMAVVAVVGIMVLGQKPEALGVVGLLMLGNREHLGFLRVLLATLHLRLRLKEALAEMVGRL